MIRNLRFEKTWLEKRGSKKGDTMDNMEDFTFDIKNYTLTHENTGFVIHAEDVMMNEDAWVIETIRQGCGVELDNFFIEVLRDTIETSSIMPYGN